MGVRPSDDASYFRARAIEEQIAAQTATCAAARLRHDELAAMYRFRQAMLQPPALMVAEPKRLPARA